MADVFISHSRREQDFVRALHRALGDHGRETWVDWEDIPPTAKWLTEVYAAIDEQSYPPDHPNVAINLNNLAQVLKATNRLAEAEPLSRRTVEIVLKFRKATGTNIRTSGRSWSL